MGHRYRTTLRPISFCTLPSNLKWQYVEIPLDDAHYRPDLPVSRHRYGVFETDRELTPTELRHFDIETA